VNQYSASQGGLGSASISMAQQAQASQQIQNAYNTPKQTSQLEAVLSQVHDLRVQLGSTADRALLLSDRLFGPQPSETGSSGQCLNQIQGVGQPPLISRIESALAEARAVLNTLNNHLERLSRL
jgi:hypothetical protein